MATGKIIQIIGPVIDVEFPRESIPQVYEALKLVNTWFEPIEILTSTALIYVLTIFLISMLAKRVSDRFRNKFGLAAHA